MGTGCIFSEIEQNYGDGYTEEDKPDFFGSSYSTVRGYSDRIMHFFENSALNLRIRTVSYTHLRAHETVLDLVCRLLLEKKKQIKDKKTRRKKQHKKK